MAESVVALGGDSFVAELKRGGREGVQHQSDDASGVGFEGDPSHGQHEFNFLKKPLFLGDFRGFLVVSRGFWTELPFSCGL